MLKKLVKLLLCQKKQENFQANNIVAKSDRATAVTRYSSLVDDEQGILLDPLEDGGDGVVC